MEFNHISVLLNECIEGLNIKENGIYVDGTLGGGGHSSHIAAKLTTGRLIGIDQDTDAIQAASKRLEPYKNVFTAVHSNFYNVREVLDNLGIEKVDGFLLDLGVSSYQLDEADRGFSYMHDAPLDMRMNRENEYSAWNVVNEKSEKELNDIIFKYGEEKWAKRIAQFIVQERAIKPIETTYELVEVIKKAVPKGARRDGPHPAKRTFQAIRIEVNDELNILESSLKDAVNLLNKGGRICVITFHSLEDRIVKQTFKSLSEISPLVKGLPVIPEEYKPLIKLINKKPVLPSKEELAENSRSRSAKLRIIERL